MRTNGGRAVLVRLFGASLACSLQLYPLSAQERSVTPEKEALIRRVLVLTKAADLAMNSIGSAITVQRAANPQVPAEFWDEFEKRIRQEAPKFVDALVPIYDSQFSVSQLRELITFYQSPLGQHLVNVQPAIAQQSIQAGRRWGSQISSEIAQGLARRGRAPVTSERSRY